MANGLATYRQRVTAGGRVKLAARGVFMYLKETSFPLSISLRQNELATRSGLVFKQTVRKGEKWYSATEFDQVEIENSSLTDDNDFEIVLGYGDYARELPERLSAADFTRIAAVEIVATGIPQVLVAAEGFRKRLVVQARLANDPAGVQIAESDAQIAAGNYEELLPAQSNVFETKNGYSVQGTIGDVISVREEIYND